MAVLNLTKAEAFALEQMVRLEIGGGFEEGVRMGVAPHIDYQKLREKIEDLCPLLEEVEHLLWEE